MSECLDYPMKIYLRGGESTKKFRILSDFDPFPPPILNEHSLRPVKEVDYQCMCTRTLFVTSKVMRAHQGFCLHARMHP